MIPYIGIFRYNSLTLRMSCARPRPSTEFQITGRSSVIPRTLRPGAPACHTFGEKSAGSGNLSCHHRHQGGFLTSSTVHWLWRGHILVYPGHFQVCLRHSLYLSNTSKLDLSFPSLYFLLRVLLRFFSSSVNHNYHNI